MPLSESHNIVLGVGNSETGIFYQVPIIKISGGKANEGVDVMVSGRIDEKGKAEALGEPRKLSDMSQEFYGVGMENANRVYAVAFVPISELIGEDMVVGGIGGTGLSVYHLIANGFAMERKVVGGYFDPTDLFGGGMVDAVSGISDNVLIPVMYPGEDGKERYLKLGDILADSDVSDLGKQGIYPGITFVSGGFSKPSRPPALYSKVRDDIGGVAQSMAMFADVRDVDLGTGRVGVEVGGESDVEYGRTNGTITGIDGVLSLHFIGVGDQLDQGTLAAEVKKLTR